MTRDGEEERRAEQEVGRRNGEGWECVRAEEQRRSGENLRGARERRGGEKVEKGETRMGGRRRKRQQEVMAGAEEVSERGERKRGMEDGGRRGEVSMGDASWWGGREERREGKVSRGGWQRRSVRRILGGEDVAPGGGEGRQSGQDKGRGGG